MRQRVVRRDAASIAGLNMTRHRTRHLVIALMAVLIALVAVFIFFGAGAETAHAESKTVLQTLRVGDAYNRLYNPKELEKIKAKVVKLTETAPMPGMSPVVALEVREGNQTVTVHLCPSWFAKPAETGIRPGDDVVIRGSWAEINGKDVFMASKVKKGESQEFKVRLTKDGTPFWTMTPEQLARERAAKDD